MPDEGDDRRRGVWLILIASGLVIAAVALAWAEARRLAGAAQQLAIVGELQLGARDVSALSALAVAGDRAALQQLRSRTESLQSTLAALVDGGIRNGQTFAPATGDLQTRLNEFAGRWADFRQKTDTLLVAHAPESKPAKETGRGPAQRSPAAAAQKAAGARAGRGAEAGPAAAAVLATGSALAVSLDSIGTELQARSAQSTWLAYLALACAFAALATLAALFVSTRRSAAAIERTVAESRSALLEGLRPAMRTLRIEADALADPGAFGRRLSAEILVVIDGIKVLVKALDTATAEADKFAVVGHVAAQALAAAERRAAQTGSSLQATARRVAAVSTALSAGAREVQQQSAKTLEAMGTASGTVKQAVRAAEQLREGMANIAGRYAQTVAAHSEIEQGLLEVADQLTQAEGFALRAVDRLAGAGSEEGAAFARDVRSYLGPTVTMLRQATELVQKTGREADDFANALGATAALAGHPSRAALDASVALGYVEGTMHELSARIASMTRLASPVEASQLLSALDEIVSQIAQSSASARQVLEATQDAATRIEELAKLLNTMRPPSEALPDQGTG